MHLAGYPNIGLVLAAEHVAMWHQSGRIACLVCDNLLVWLRAAHMQSKLTMQSITSRLCKLRERLCQLQGNIFAVKSVLGPKAAFVADYSTPSDNTLIFR